MGEKYGGFFALCLSFASICEAEAQSGIYILERQGRSATVCGMEGPAEDMNLLLAWRDFQELRQALNTIESADINIDLHSLDDENREEFEKIWNRSTPLPLTEDRRYAEYRIFYGALKSKFVQKQDDLLYRPSRTGRAHRSRTFPLWIALAGIDFVQNRPNAHPRIAAGAAGVFAASWFLRRSLARVPSNFRGNGSSPALSKLRRAARAFSRVRKARNTALKKHFPDVGELVLVHYFFEFQDWALTSLSQKEVRNDLADAVIAFQQASLTTQKGPQFASKREEWKTLHKELAVALRNYLSFEYDYLVILLAEELRDISLRKMSPSARNVAQHRVYQRLEKEFDRLTQKHSQIGPSEPIQWPELKDHRNLDDVIEDDLKMNPLDIATQLEALTEQTFDVMIRNGFSSNASHPISDT